MRLVETDSETETDKNVEIQTLTESHDRKRSSRRLRELDQKQKKNTSNVSKRVQLVTQKKADRLENQRRARVIQSEVR